MKELLDEQARMQDRHEADVHQMSRQAQDAQVQLNGLYEILLRIDSGSQSSFGELRLPRHRPRTRTTESRGTGQPPESLDISTPPISPAFQSASSRFFTNFSLLLSRQDRRDPSISQAPELQHISTWFEEVSGAARAQHVAMEDLLERMCQLEFERAQEVESSELEKNHLLDEWAKFVSCVATSIERKKCDGMSRLTSNMNWTCVRQSWKRFKMRVVLGGSNSSRQSSSCVYAALTRSH
ncbi:hypothetical protein BGW80DRAFT_1373519 [Lactifluus volemus]|nr:hypothetical protein BGW80DRAFT_1373519 [Lactifluus volemus]